MSEVTFKPGPFLRKLVDMANGNMTQLDGTMKPVDRLLDENQLVFAIWQDKNSAHGVGHLVIKGSNLLRTVVGDQVTGRVRTTAIPCMHYEQAVALKQTRGDLAHLH